MALGLWMAGIGAALAVIAAPPALAWKRTSTWSGTNAGSPPGIGNVHSAPGNAAPLPSTAAGPVCLRVSLRVVHISCCARASEVLRVVQRNS